MKLVVTIPAFNEEKTIGKVIQEIPKKIKGIKKIEVIVIDDGSTDETATVAKKFGAKIIKNKENLGLATSFKKGLDAALLSGADIIVNTDADFQYDQTQIPILVEPILNGNADIVLGSRFKGTIEGMPFSKKIGNKIVTAIVRFISGKPISDAQTGFRAFTRDAAMKINVYSNYTYVQETIIEAVDKRLVINEVPVRFRRRDGKSRLMSGVFDYARKAGTTIIRGYINHKPMGFFVVLGGLIFFAGFLVGLRVLLHFLKTGNVSPYLPSTILSIFAMLIGFQIIIIGLVADMIRHNRKINDEILYNLKRQRKH